MRAPLVASVLMAFAPLWWSCGRVDDEPETEDHRTDVSGGVGTVQSSGADATVHGPTGPAGPAGTDGAAGIPGSNGKDGANGAQGPAGDQGASGEDGLSGPTGAPGKDGQMAGIALFDKNDVQLGWHVADSDTAATIFLLDGAMALLDKSSGKLRAPAFHFLCMYESPDCLGSCFVYDRRWLNVVVNDAAGNPYRAPQKAPDLGGRTFLSYADDGGTCEATELPVTESFQAQPYAGTTSFPVAAPLYWKLVD